METKIAALDTLLLAVPLNQPTRLPVGNWTARRNLIVIVETSDGTRGYGEVWINFPIWGCQDRIAVITEFLRPMLIGEPLDDPRRLFAMMTERTRALARRWQASGPVSHAIAGVDIALWDAFARQRGLPLRNAIAGQDVNPVVKVYASGVGPDSVEEAIEEAIRNGHNRFKLRLVQGPDPDRAVLHAARKAAGELELMADPGEIYSPTSLKEIWNDIGQAGISWLEEPFPTDEPEMYDEFRSWSPRPKLALGESSYGITGIKSLIDRFQPEVVQPDITKTGGISEGIHLARYTLEKGREFVPHMLAGPIGFLASANLVAGIDGAEMVEMDCAPVPTFGPMAGGVPEVANGEIRLGNEVGHGAVVDEAQLSDWIEV